ncbi:hypothetical protein LSUB1_G006539 [Lachnellula subtilissima]|uniref:Uncharacterized protein n=1 Tax=Lachnellula subtilissima TaxID=602034 RepID=A0A8H8RES3_9HELO|nr:hypothetical protein LSUB1_G006539 [Lachnellula subtilissima]
MPLFNRNSTGSTTKAPSKAPVTTTTDRPQRSSTLFGRRETPPAATKTTSPPRHNLLHRNHEDASIVNARERVQNAEAAEKDADRALIQARAAVKEARAHVKKVELEAAEEARLARIKQEQASSISKRAQPLGRHNHA